MKCRRHQIEGCKACTKIGYSNVTRLTPRRDRPHISFVFGYWRVSPLTAAMALAGSVSEVEMVLDRWKEAQQRVNAWNAYTDQHARMIAPQLWKPAP